MTISVGILFGVSESRIVVTRTKRYHVKQRFPGIGAFPSEPTNLDYQALFTLNCVSCIRDVKAYVQNRFECTVDAYHVAVPALQYYQHAILQQAFRTVDPNAQLRFANSATLAVSGTQLHEQATGEPLYSSALDTDDVEETFELLVQITDHATTIAVIEIVNDVFTPRFVYSAQELGWNALVLNLADTICKREPEYKSRPDEEVNAEALRVFKLLSTSQQVPVSASNVTITRAQFKEGICGSWLEAFADTLDEIRTCNVEFQHILDRVSRVLFVGDGFKWLWYWKEAIESFFAHQRCPCVHAYGMSLDNFAISDLGLSDHCLASSSSLYIDTIPASIGVVFDGASSFSRPCTLEAWRAYKCEFLVQPNTKGNIVFTVVERRMRPGVASNSDTIVLGQVVVNGKLQALKGLNRDAISLSVQLGLEGAVAVLDEQGNVVYESAFTCSELWKQRQADFRGAIPMLENSKVCIGGMHAPSAEAAHEQVPLAPETIIVHIARAKNLAKADVLGLSDPYVNVSVNKKTLDHTRIINRSLNPEWDETLYLSLPQGTKVTDELLFQVYDHDRIGSDDFLGQVAIRIREISTDGEPMELQLGYNPDMMLKRQKYVQGRLVVSFLSPQMPTASFTAGLNMAAAAATAAVREDPSRVPGRMPSPRPGVSPRNNQNSSKLKWLTGENENLSTWERVTGNVPYGKLPQKTKDEVLRNHRRYTKPSDSEVESSVSSPERTVNASTPKAPPTPPPPAHQPPPHSPDTASAPSNVDASTPNRANGHADTHASPKPSSVLYEKAIDLQKEYGAKQPSEGKILENAQASLDEFDKKLISILDAWDHKYDFDFAKVRDITIQFVSWVQDTMLDRIQAPEFTKQRRHLNKVVVKSVLDKLSDCASRIAE